MRPTVLKQLCAAKIHCQIIRQAVQSRLSDNGFYRKPGNLFFK